MRRIAAALAACLWLSAAAPAAAKGAGDAAKGEAAPAFQVENSAVHTLRARASGRAYDLYVKVPPGYAKPENAGRRYPVLYLNDGPYTFQVASGVSRVPFSQGLFEEFILVGLSWAHGEDPADSRSRDLTPWPNPRMARPTGGAKAYWEFLKTEAIPFVEARYRIDPARRTLAGQSYGALFGLWVAFNDPGTFGNYVLTSPSIWFRDRAILEAEEAYAARHEEMKARLYLAIGGQERPGTDCARCTFDMVADQELLAQRLRSRNHKGLELRSEVVEGAFHETTFPVGLIRAMQWLYLKKPAS
ncbi:MAG TPA: alpha/beta hydrolase-fold protein [Azospirillaceae bacterium]|nr:alpha/beta hydrolase-fold protein [Azospirillaceae bacterium]